jgi:hypothetical protein
VQQISRNFIVHARRISLTALQKRQVSKEYFILLLSLSIEEHGFKVSASIYSLSLLIMAPVRRALGDITNTFVDKTFVAVCEIFSIKRRVKYRIFITFFQL